MLTGKRRLAMMLGVVVLVLASGLVYWFGWHRNVAPVQPNRSATTSTSAPVIVPTLTIPTDKLQLIGVRTVTADVQDLTRTLRVNGRVEYNEQKRYAVNSRFEGWIEKLDANYAGKFVRKGAPIAEIYSPELLAAQQEYLNLLKWQNEPVPSANNDAYSNQINARLNRDSLSVFAAAKRKLQLYDISDAQLAEISRSGVPRRTLTLYSPASGYITGKNMLQGQKFMAGETIVEIADLSSVWLVAEVYSDAISAIRPGQPATIALTYFPEKIYRSRIDYIYPALTPETRTLKVRFVLPNPDFQLKPDMFSEVTIALTLGRKLVVPQDAVIDSGTSQLVYVAKGQGVFEPRPVQTGLKSDGWVEITHGLSAGESVVSAANFLLDSEARLKGLVQ